MDWLEERAPELVEDIKVRFTKFFDHLIYKTNVPEEYYSTSYVKERTNDFLERFSEGKYGNKPFFFHCSFPDPHHPICPPGKYGEIYKPEDIEVPSNFKDLERLKKHPFLGEFLNNPILEGALIHATDDKEKVQNYTAGVYNSMTMVDDAIGSILSTLERLGLSDNTMVIYTSDHGDLMGDHGLLLKGLSPFSGVMRVPLLWKVPKITKPSISDSLISSIDIPKTILHLLNINPKRHPPDMQGYDYTPVLSAPEETLRDSLFIENEEELGPFRSRLRTVVTREFKLTVYEGINDYGDLFDRINDPEELNNLWDSNKELKTKMLDKLLHESLKALSRYPARQSPS